MKKIRVLHVCDALDKGGLEEVIYNLVKNTNSQEFEVGVAYFKGGVVADRLKEKGFNCQEINETNKYSRIQQLKNYIKEGKFDIVQAHFCFHGILAAKLAGVKVIETTHNTYHFFENPWGRTKYSFYLNLVNSVVSVSKAVENFNLTNFKVLNKKKCTVIRNSIDSERIIPTERSKEDLKRELGLPENAFVISTLSRLDVQKGIEYFIEAAKMLNQKYENLVFLIPGEGAEPYSQTLKKQAEGINNIRFIGHVSKVNELFKVMDVYAMTSLWEGAPLTLLEAMAYGKPVVVTNVGNTAEVIQDNMNGFIVEKKDVNAFVERLSRFIEDPTKRFELEQQAQKDFNEKFSNHIMISNYKQLYLSLLEG
ncbi:glycosyltransferase family 4 protein [Neobacillus rhizosphaerae]|uniref:glycosyltransferase family 4 protein n=1 Tax=Neobacillus rhizosphaerae TaxID=2880965 RepID=UPI003D2A7F8F